MWENAQTMLRAALDENGVDYFEEAEGGGSLLRSKTRYPSKNDLANEETLSTIQWTSSCQSALTSSMSALTVEEHRPVMIHRGVISQPWSALQPSWLKITRVPSRPGWLRIKWLWFQFLMKPISDYAWQVAKKLRDKGVRADGWAYEKNAVQDSLPHKLARFLYQLIVGDKK